MRPPGTVGDLELNKFVETEDGPAVRVFGFGDSGGSTSTISPVLEFLLNKFFSDVDFDEIILEKDGDDEIYSLLLAGTEVDALSVLKTPTGFRYVRGIVVAEGILTETGIQLLTEGGDALILEG